MNDEKSNDVKSLLEDIKGILLLVNQDKIDEAKKRLVRSGTIEEIIYKMCDGNNTTPDIANKIQKDNQYAGAVISSLRQKGLIKTIEKDGKKVHEQRF